MQDSGIQECSEVGHSLRLQEAADSRGGGCPTCIRRKCSPQPRNCGMQRPSHGARGM
ncbi:hypothetical protein HYPSUDRAFT_49246 [Hypholoma sublateritium FD-334 SS-4]|uniref:Uncharacterized protein n=1 Tax=Hypholoma sublateritium (strain FD-334 SS-4) TaxID=945553 RepID=A0A0D2LU14_HYPSF|nr:hypothetical protein HYPSUDRAFT_49246 [Hypholoma sublateritium FD-334 SS-4]